MSKILSLTTQFELQSESQPILSERTTQRMTDLKRQDSSGYGLDERDRRGYGDRLGRPRRSRTGSGTQQATSQRRGRRDRRQRRQRDVPAHTLGDLESARELVEWATEAGDGHVDILINNAGVAVLGPSSAATEAEFDESFALNVKVPFFLVASLAPAMAERGWGSIVNVSTMVASFGRPAWPCTAPAGRLSSC